MKGLEDCRFFDQQQKSWSFPIRRQFLRSMTENTFSKVYIPLRTQIYNFG